MKYFSILLLIIALAGCDNNTNTGSSSSPESKTDTMSNYSEVFDMIKDDLVDANGNKVAGDKLKENKYLLIYFSAHWCPPCRRFTPKLVDRYNKGSEGYQVVFASSDRSQKEMQNYMNEMKMPWPAIKYGTPLKKQLQQKFGVDGIPCLVMLDNTGKLVSHSYRNGKYVGPYEVLADLDKFLKQ